ncbi:MAG: LppP/LprE family lipoprotein, partial [Alicyclobacillus herbarius]|uniref:LppP/LprE family lipoprotein n=1 Tax=Alicyclobacillus herbarius TaxID=122960 RepID=UPI0023550248
TDTSAPHSRVVDISPAGTGSIRVAYAHYEKGDPMCCPSGAPYVVTFHWNGAHMVASNPAVLDAVMNHQW